ncbi:uncharacterized protein EI90DRAFT_2260516 [Cantharellus anzutake]|uniref:uncharacterized protein n=1 Tax=Cantharellus anzutake TaxID=1750568 RepID=UPI001905DE2C|nr:uncharacterized protein EI90DRAFT_2260516 [Cantharellus anzutake]KAF8339625.1 hypothetical protein EI90DRAFT_2260516 [Cantharellus anzutake]
MVTIIDPLHQHCITRPVILSTSSLSLRSTCLHTLCASHVGVGRRARKSRIHNRVELFFELHERGMAKLLKQGEFGFFLPPARLPSRLCSVSLLPLVIARLLLSRFSLYCSLCPQLLFHLACASLSLLSKNPNGHLALESSVAAETLRMLDDVVRQFTAETLSLSRASALVNAIIADETSFTESQADQTRQRYGDELEQITNARLCATAKGERRLGGTRETTEIASGPDGAQQLDAPLPRPTAQPERDADTGPGIVAFGKDPAVQFKRVADEEDDHRAEYAWNWGFGNGGPPWSQTAAGTLNDAQKTQALRNVYDANIKRAVRSLFKRGGMPEFPPHLWEDILANHLINFEHLIDHDRFHSLRYDDAVEIFSTKLSTDGQWLQAWVLYAEAVVWAFPHRNAELQIYRRHIVRRFNATGAALTLKYDQAARKFLHTSPHLSFANTGELQEVLHDVYLRGNTDARSNFSGGSGERSSSAIAGKKRKRGMGDYPICREFNRTDGCRRAECRYLHKCSTCGTSTHGEAKCSKTKEKA